MRKLSKTLHQILSIVVGIFISIICFSGAMLIFENEFIEWQNPDLYNVTPLESGARPLTSLLPEILATQPQGAEITYIDIKDNPSKSYRIDIDFGDDKSKTVFVNQYTGKILGEAPDDIAFFTVMYRLHRFLLQSRPQGDGIFWGKRIVGISTIIFVFIIITGIVVWVPRRGRSWGNRFKISVKHGWHRLWYDLHVAGGIYVALLLLVMALTGLTWAFPWYRTAFYGIFAPERNELSTTENASFDIAANNPTDTTTLTQFAVWQRVYDAVKQRSNYVEVSISSDEVRARISDCGNRRASDYYEFDTATGAITSVELYKNTSNNSKLRGWVYSLHTGSWGGFWVRLIYFIAAMFGATLPLTGYYLWIRRTLRSKKQHSHE
ncbi:MAG: PepSY domain-containing protein [Bacteroidetes bacterium]|nr:PepSY domain-containing protein [Bacteroidota bacterium]